MLPFLDGLAVCGVMAVGAGSMVYQSRRSRRAAKHGLERVRAGIAADLHDDIGPGLSQIALLAELAGRRVNREPEIAELLEQIGGVSRALLDSLGDVVWSVDPGKDTLDETIQRMRVFAAGVSLPASIRFRFRASAPDSRLRLDAGFRRNLFLVFKEALHNVVRHSHCAQADVYLGVAGEHLVLRIKDDGQGFDCHRAGLGRGLANMSKRARDLDGDFRVTSGEGGTTVTVRIPVSGRLRRPGRSDRAPGSQPALGWLNQAGLS
jgi:signal transduction histidine kinase